MTETTRILNEADQTLHSLAQLIALTAMQALPVEPDDCQSNMVWNEETRQLEGRPFAYDGQPVRLVIDLPLFTVQFMRAAQVLAALPPEGKTPDQVMDWWQSQVKAFGLTADKPLSYQMTQEPVARNSAYTRPAGLNAWAHWRSVANKALTRLNDWAGRQSAMRIWPHHFDTGVYYAMPDKKGHEVAAIWAGYAIADAVCDEPYFYIPGYISGATIDFSAGPLLTAGEWRSEVDWKGALLPVSASSDSQVVDRFFQESFAWLDRQTVGAF